MKTIVVKIICLVALIGATGCTSLKYKSKEGATFESVSFLAKRNINELSVEESEKGLPKVTLKGYSNDQAEAAAAITSAAVSAALKK